MELTLQLPSAEAARLQRLPNVRSSRIGRSRAHTLRIVWHDSLDRALASRGLVLADQRGTWRLERYRPVATDPWPPATDHRVVLEADGPDALREALAEAGPPDEAANLPDATTPVAAFDGRRTVFPLVIDGEPVSMTVLDGVLRAVAAERPVTRLVLEGPTAPVRTLVLSLAETLSLTVPEQSLAAEAQTLADGSPPVPRRHGPPELPPDGLTADAAFRHILGHLTDVILHLSGSVADVGSGHEPVHQMRVAVRRARSAFSLFQPDMNDPAMKAGAEGLKRLGHVLGPARDWDVFMTETAPPVEAVLPGQAALHSLLRAGARRRHAAREALSGFLGTSAFRVVCLELACLAAADPPPAEPAVAGTPAPTLAEFAAEVLRKRWKKLLRVGRALDDLDTPELHGLRLKAKRLRYAAEFFAPLFPRKPASRFIHRLAILQDRLGSFNDTMAAEALLHELSANPGYAAGLVLGFTAARGERARSKIATAWGRFRRRDPFWL